MEKPSKRKANKIEISSPISASQWGEHENDMLDLKSDEIKENYQNSNQNYRKVLLETIESMTKSEECEYSYENYLAPYYEPLLNDSKQENPNIYTKHFILQTMKEFPQNKYNKIKQKSGEIAAKQWLTDNLHDYLISKSIDTIWHYIDDKETKRAFRNSSGSLYDAIKKFENDIKSTKKNKPIQINKINETRETLIKILLETKVMLNKDNLQKLTNYERIDNTK